MRNRIAIVMAVVGQNSADAQYHFLIRDARVARTRITQTSSISLFLVELSKLTTSVVNDATGLGLVIIRKRFQRYRRQSIKLRKHAFILFRLSRERPFTKSEFAHT